jgi:hypothetical protein
MQQDAQHQYHHYAQRAGRRPCRVRETEHLPVSLPEFGPKSWRIIEVKLVRNPDYCEDDFLSFAVAHGLEAYVAKDRARTRGHVRSEQTFETHNST